MYRHQKQLRMRLIFTSILYLLLNVHVNCTSYSLNTRKDEKTRTLLTKRKLPVVWCSNGMYCNMPSGWIDGSYQSCGSGAKQKNHNIANCGDCPLGYFAKAKREVDWQGKLLERRRPGSSYVQYSYSESCTSCSGKLILKTNNFFLGYLYDLYRHTT